MNNFRFTIGDRVEHVSGGMSGTITARSRTAVGHEMYCVELADIQDERRLRQILWQYLKAA